jgi:hypothetical protein
MKKNWTLAMGVGALLSAGPALAQNPPPLGAQPPQPVPVNMQVPQSAHAAGVLPDENARCMLRVVHAQPHEGGVDPRLATLRGKFERPPFTQWKSFHQLSAQEQELRPGGSVEYILPGGRHATVVYAEHATNARGRHVVRGSLHLEGARSTSRVMFSVDEGGTFTIAGAKHEDGILIYSLSCKTEK